MSVPTESPISGGRVRALRAMSLGKLNDADLVAALRRKTPGAPLAFFERYAPRVERVLTRILGPTADVSDLINEVFSRALNRLDAICDPSGVDRWLMTITTFVAREHIGAARRRRWLVFRPSEELPEATAEAPTEAREAIARVYRVLDKLSDDDRVVFALRYVEGLELMELAEVLGTSLSTAKRRLWRAQERFFSVARRDEVLQHWLDEEGRHG